MRVDAATAPGTLVLLTTEERLTPIGEDEALDFNGAQAQLVENGGDLGLLVLSFNGYFLQVPLTACRLLTAEELHGYDLVLGPKSCAEGLAQQMPDLLLQKGYVTTHVMLPARTHAGILATVKELDDYFARLPTEFELGYLGRGSRTDRVAMLESLESAAASGLLAQEHSVAEHLRLMKSKLLHTFGFRLSSRTTLLLRLSGTNSDTPPAEPPNATQAEAFLALMGRKRLCVLRFLGPSGGTLRLMPKKDEAEVTMDVCVNMQVVFLTQQYEYHFDPSGECLVLQSFFLEEPLQLVFQKALEGKFSTGLSAPVMKTPKGQQILVKGMASRDPCEADLHEKLWAAVRHGGCDGFLEIPKTRFDVDLYIDYEDQQRAMASSKSYCRHQGHIEGIEIFDAAFFNIPEQDVRGMDPEQRIFMETGWMALADAGYKREQVRIDSAHLGVFVGISGSDWRDVCRAPSANGVPETFIANRFSYVINLKGPSFIVNTACSASLVALHSAKTHLIMQEDPLDGCLVAGISLNVSPGTWIGNCQGAMLSFRGRCFSFNATADGYGRGEGCAAAVLGRGKYNRDDDTTCGSLAASHSNSDGRSASLTAPNGPAQQRLLRAALGEARLQPTQLDIYEAHGTGTSLGDPIEVSAVRKVLTTREHPVIISCSKPNLGHLEGGAGMSAFCKCILACMHAEAAGNQHLRVQNPNLDIEGWPAFLLQEAATLKSDGSYVGVSGFGYGGTNSHALAFGHNVITSRGDNQKHSAQAVIRQVRSTAPEINMVGDNYEDWQTTGLPHLSMKSGQAFEVEVMQGSTHWHELVPVKPRGVNSMSIIGSFNNWVPETMRARERPGLFSYEVTLGQEEETFQVLVDGLLSQVLHPLQAKCTSRCSQVAGPRDVNNREMAWLLKGKPRATFQVDVFIPPGEAKCMSVTWFKATKAAPPAPAPAPPPLPPQIEELGIEE